MKPVGFPSTFVQFAKCAMYKNATGRVNIKARNKCFEKFIFSSSSVNVLFVEYFRVSLHNSKKAF